MFFYQKYKASILDPFNREIAEKLMKKFNSMETNYTVEFNHAACENSYSKETQFWGTSIPQR